MKNLLLILPLLLVSGVQASDWKFSVTLGTGNIDYEEDQFVKTVDSNGQVIPLLENGVQIQNNISDTYTPSIYGFGYGNGKHTFGYKVTSASASNYDVETNGETSTYISTIADRDYDETTISYQYRLNASWTLGIAYNDKEHEYIDKSSKSYALPASLSTLLQAGENLDYTWTRDGQTDSTQDGFAVYATWQKPITNVWVFAAKIGVSQTELDQQYSQVRTITGIPTALNQLYVDAGFGNLEGETITFAGYDEGDSTTVYGGLSLVRIFPSAPSHQIIFSVDARTDDLAGTSFSTINGAGTGYFDSGETAVADQEAAQGGNDIEEYNLKYTLEYKYTF